MDDTFQLEYGGAPKNVSSLVELVQVEKSTSLHICVA